MEGVRKKAKSCLGLRLGTDFAHMTMITAASYGRAIDHLLSTAGRFQRIILLSDTRSAWTGRLNQSTPFRGLPVVDAFTDDVSQIYMGMQCKALVLSESSFHLWMAYFGARPESRPHMARQKVVYFYSDDPHTTPANESAIPSSILPGWVGLPA